MFVALNCDEAADPALTTDDRTVSQRLVSGESLVSNALYIIVSQQYYEFDLLLTKRVTCRGKLSELFLHRIDPSRQL